MIIEIGTHRFPGFYESLFCNSDEFIECLPSDIFKDDFLFKILDDEDNITVTSPKYYNYSTDKCYCLVETNIQTLESIKEFGLKHENAEQYIIDHFTSYDGFHSFINNDIEYWKSLKIKEYIEEERYIIALLDMIIALNDSNGFEEIALSTFYEIDKYYYAEPIIYCSEESKDVIQNNYSPNVKIKTV